MKQSNPHHLEEESQQEINIDSEENSDDSSTELIAELSNKAKQPVQWPVPLK